MLAVHLLRKSLPPYVEILSPSSVKSQTELSSHSSLKRSSTSNLCHDTKNSHSSSKSSTSTYDTKNPQSSSKTSTSTHNTNLQLLREGVGKLFHHLETSAQDVVSKKIKLDESVIESRGSGWQREYHLYRKGLEGTKLTYEREKYEDCLLYTSDAADE